MNSRLAGSILPILAAWAMAVTAHAAGRPLVEWRGTHFSGGAQHHFGSAHYGRTDVNYVYAQSTGPAATLTATFALRRVPRERLFLILEAMDDDAATRTRIRILLNGRELFRGPSGFPDAGWATRRFPIEPDTLVAGTNVLTLGNEEPQGTLGAPPWFMVARAAVAGAAYTLPSVTPPTVTVRLPRKPRPLPEPLSARHPDPGFKFRGTKGWGWTAEQYLEEIPVLSRLRMNFLMNCYLSMFTSRLGEPWLNEWWKPLPEAKREAYARVIRACQEHGIQFCFAVHPQLGSPRPLDPSSAADLDQFFQHYAWAQGQGVRWFSVSLDDVSWGTRGPAEGGAAHTRLVNAVFSRLRAKDAGAQLIFCPVPYWGDGTAPEPRAYLEALGQELHPDVYLFWTGDAVVTPRITRAAASSYRRIARHRLFLWDNYPVNDSSPTLHLGPVRGRDPDLGEVIDGYMSNPMAAQNQINRLPLATCADYAYNPWAYDPDRSIGQAILFLASSHSQRRVLKDLVETYPGLLVTGGGTGSNPVRPKLSGLLASDGGRTAATNFVRQFERMATGLATEFPGQFPATRKTLADDLDWMKRQLAETR